LSQSYNLKAIADYETGPGSKVSPERAAATIEAGKRFVAKTAELLADVQASACSQTPLRRRSREDIARAVLEQAGAQLSADQLGVRRQAMCGAFKQE
jgi:hypothetical protein